MRAHLSVGRVRGTRDFLPEDEIARREIISIIEQTFIEFGFSPLDTPALETGELLLSKAGESILEEIYHFKDKGGRTIGLRFDHTLPLARVIAENPNIPLPFRRYAIGKVWRYDRPQAGRYREFTQADVDIVGSPDILADAECVAAGVTALKRLNVPPFTVLYNNRKILFGWGKAVGMSEDQIAAFLRSVDKWFKIGEEGVRKELREKGLERYFDSFLDLIDKEPQDIKAKNEEMEEGIEEAMAFAEYAGLFEIPSRFDIRLARGLDYYTGNIFETYIEGQEGLGSIASGGRYDHLVALVGGRDLPATGFSIGVDRLFTILQESRRVKKRKTVTKVYVAPVKPENRKYALKVLRLLREANIPSETDVMGRNLRKQLEYAEKMGIPYVVIVGPKEEQTHTARLKNMETGEERALSLKDIASAIPK